MDSDKELRKIQIHADRPFFFLKLAPIRSMPFIRFVETQIGRKASFGDPGDHDRDAQNGFLVGDASRWNEHLAARSDRDALVLTMLQNPLEFVLEVYLYYALQIPADGETAENAGTAHVSLEEFLGNPAYARWIDNYQTAQILRLDGFPSDESTDRSSATLDASLACERLESMAFWGLLEFDRQAQDLFRYTFDRPFSLSVGNDPVEMNGSSLKDHSTVLTPDIIAEIERRNAVDLLVYDSARRLFFERYGTMTRRIASELHWKQRATSGVQVIALDPADQFSRVELAVAKCARRLREFVLPPGSKVENWVRKIYRRTRGKRSTLAYPLEGDHKPSMRTYHEWLQTQGQALPSGGHADGRTTISFLLFASADEKARLSATIQSCLASSSQDIEVLILHAEDEAEIHLELEGYRSRDARVKTHPLKLDPGYGFATAIDRARGEFLIFMHPGDRIHADLLPRMRTAIAGRDAGRPIDILYTDEDRLDAQGQRCDPWFKPGTHSPEMLLSVNYLRHAAYRRTLFDPEWLPSLAFPFQAADEWSLAFHCLENARGDIVHLPGVLYHAGYQEPHRVESESERCTQVIAGHLSRLGRRNAVVEISESGAFRATWEVDDQDRVSIVIPTKDHYRLLKRCVDTIFALTDYPNYEIVIVDTGSTSGKIRSFYTEIGDDPRIKIVSYEGEFNYSRANNLGARHASGSILLFLNNDTEALTRGWLRELVQWVQVPEIGVAGAKLLYPDGSIQGFGTVLGMLGLAHHVFCGMPEDQESIFGSTMWYRDVMAITGACMAMRREVFEWIGGFNPQYRIAFSDVEICLKVLQAGYRILCTPFARLMHHEGKSRSKLVPIEDITTGLDHFGGLLQSGDRYFNENLSLDSTVPTFRAREEIDPLMRVAHVVHLMRGDPDPSSGECRSPEVGESETGMNARRRS